MRQVEVIVPLEELVARWRNSVLKGKWPGHVEEGRKTRERSEPSNASAQIGGRRHPDSQDWLLSTVLGRWGLNYAVLGTHLLRCGCC